MKLLKVKYLVYYACIIGHTIFLYMCVYIIFSLIELYFVIFSNYKNCYYKHVLIHQKCIIYHNYVFMNNILKTLLLDKDRRQL